MLPQALDVDGPGVELTCPTCGADSQSGPECRCDLRLLQRLESERADEFKDLAAALAEGRWSDALVSAQFIHTLRHDDASFRALSVCHLLNDSLQAACDTYRNCRGSRSV